MMQKERRRLTMTTIALKKAALECIDLPSPPIDDMTVHHSTVRTVRMPEAYSSFSPPSPSYSLPSPQRLKKKLPIVKCSGFLPLILEWINALGLRPYVITTETFLPTMRSGVLLVDLCKTIWPQYTFARFYKKAKTRGTAIVNIEQVYIALVRQASIPATELPPSGRIYDGDSKSVLQLLSSCLKAFYSKSSRRTTILSMRPWLIHVWSKYGMGLEVELTWLNFWHLFSSGVRIWCLLDYYGACSEGRTGTRTHTINMAPQTIEERDSNWNGVSHLLNALDIPQVLPLTALHDDTPQARTSIFILLQLKIVHDLFQKQSASLTTTHARNHRHFSLPPRYQEADCEEEDCEEEDHEEEDPEEEDHKEEDHEEEEEHDRNESILQEDNLKKDLNSPSIQSFDNEASDDTVSIQGISSGTIQRIELEFMYQEEIRTKSMSFSQDITKDERRFMELEELTSTLHGYPKAFDLGLELGGPLM